jgi:methyltransferase (TIGR00027 family)
MIPERPRGIHMAGEPPHMSTGVHGISKTSIYVAAGRAVGAREPDRSVRNPDYLAEQFLGDPAALGVDHPAVRALSLDYEQAMQDPEVIGIVRAMMVRTRFIDAALERAIDTGATHVVILGAGFDSHAYRYRDLLQDIRVFEVERPVTQALKKERVNSVLGGPPDNLTYVPLDFEHEDLDEVLARHGHDTAKRTFFILEGVTMYVREESVRSTMSFVAAHPAGSSVVFDFVSRPMVEFLASSRLDAVPVLAQPAFQRFLNLIKDEPWVFGLPVDGERDFLAGVGLELREAFVIGGEESLQRYATKADGTQVGGAALAAATARFMERLREAGDAAQSALMDPERVRQQQRLMSYRLAEAVVA